MAYTAAVSEQPVMAKRKGDDKFPNIAQITWSPALECRARYAGDSRYLARHCCIADPCSIHMPSLCGRSPFPVPPLAWTTQDTVWILPIASSVIIPHLLSMKDGMCCIALNGGFWRDEHLVRQDGISRNTSSDPCAAQGWKGFDPANRPDGERVSNRPIIRW